MQCFALIGSQLPEVCVGIASPSLPSLKTRGGLPSRPLQVSSEHLSRYSAILATEASGVIAVSVDSRRHHPAAG